MSQATLSDTFSRTELLRSAAQPARLDETAGAAERDITTTAFKAECAFAALLMVASFGSVLFLGVWSFAQVASFLTSDKSLFQFLFHIGGV